MAAIVVVHLSTSIPRNVNEATTHEAEATTYEAEATTHEAEGEAKIHLEIHIIII